MPVGMSPGNVGSGIMEDEELAGLSKVEAEKNMEDLENFNQEHDFMQREDVGGGYVPKGIDDLPHWNMGKEFSVNHHVGPNHDQGRNGLLVIPLVSKLGSPIILGPTDSRRFSLITRSPKSQWLGQLLLMTTLGLRNALDLS
ncbi:hypothetical protein Hanom_Chr01g00011871 [Helianthus anomalus]